MFHLALYRTWWEAGHSAEMHVYARGGHGFAMRVQGAPCDGWYDRYLEWLRSLDG